MTLKNILLPGENICSSNDFSSTNINIFKKNSSLFSSVVGFPKPDYSSKFLNVYTFKKFKKLRNNDIIYGVVTDTNQFNITIDIISYEFSFQKINYNRSAILHVSKISSEYSKNASDLFSKGDIIKASVLNVKFFINITTSNKNLGIIKSLCNYCKNDLVLTKINNLYCKKCDKQYIKKVSSDYGNIFFK